MKNIILAALGTLFILNFAGFFVCSMASPKGHNEYNSSILRKPTIDAPNVEIGVHNIGQVWMTVTNIGQFGLGYLGDARDPVTGIEAPSCQFPATSNHTYLYVGSFWIGAVVGRDTLVSIGVDDYYSVIELWPGPFDRIKRRSMQTSSPFFEEDAKSEQDIIAVYTDTLTNPSYVAIDNTDGRPHIPLNVEITQRSYAWSYAYAEDFILYDYSIKNVGRKKLEKVYMGVYVDGDVHDESIAGFEGYGDDLCGFRQTNPSIQGCGFTDTINIAYITDNDGDPTDQGNFAANSALGAAGVRVVRTPSDSLEYSFNWWVTDYSDPSHDFGPRKYGTPDDPFRDMNGILGTPLGDPNKYYVMRHQEFDYDQLFVAEDNSPEGWLPPPENARDFADGFDARYLLSFGPFDIYPGEVLPVSFAWVLGDNIHVEPDDFEEFVQDRNPEDYYSKWNFDDLAKNSVWASWIYDNPGFDTDGDDYRGKYRICCYDSSLVENYDTLLTDPLVIETTLVWEGTVCDTIFYEGDKVPDFRGAAPPPAPELWVVNDNGDTLMSKFATRVNENGIGEIRVRWNGFYSETEKDVFSNKADFEGYRVYLSYSPNSKNFTLIASYDLEDYDRFEWNQLRRTWELKDTPFTIDSLRALYGDDFSPLEYTRERPFIWNDTAYYFQQQDWNQSNLTDTLGIHKVFPNTNPPTIPNIDSARIYYPEELTDDGLFFKYYEYEFIIRDLLPSQQVYVAVTAFDYGSPTSGLGSLETQPLNNYVAEYPQNHARIVEEEGLDVVVYPNPYRIDANYQQYGFEGRDYIDNKGQLIKQENLPDDRTRSIHFTNLPSKCTIRIYTIDGDLVREIEHDVPPDFPQSSHERWDLITRNTQAAVSGIYYYSVESSMGNQVGKLVIIK